MFIASILVSLVLTGGPAFGAAAPPQTAQAPAPAKANVDDGGVRAAIAEYVAARDRGDEAALRKLFTPDADQLVSTGEWRRGRDQLVAGTLASSKTNSGVRTIAVENVRMPAPDVALADGRYTIAASGSTPERNMWTSFVLVRSNGVWRIAAIRNMLPAAAAPAPAAK